MNAEQQAFLNMCAAVRATTDPHAADWEDFTPFADPYAEFLATLDTVPAAAAKQSTSSEGTTLSKGALRKSVEADGLKLARGIVLAATLAGNTQLAKDARRSKTFFYNLGEAKLIGEITELQQMATGFTQTALDAVKIPAAFRAAMQTRLDSFVEATGAPKRKRVQAADGTKMLAAAITKLRSILADRMDPAADVLEDDAPTFVSEYRMAREIEDPGYGVRELTVVVSDSSTGNPLPDVLATIAPGGIQKTTGAAGGFYIEDMEGGDYEMTLTLPGYAQKVVAFSIVDGQALTVPVSLSLDGGGTDQ